MSSPFDPYHQWLGIPPAEQPPHHYRLLGITPFEEQPDVIEHAADQRMGHLKSFQAGKHSAQSQKLLNEMAAARLCLLNPQKKAVYDAQLRAELQSQAERSDDSLDSGLKEAIQQAQTRKIATATDATLKSPPNLRALIAAGAGVAVVLLGLIVWWAASGKKPQGSGQESEASGQQPSGSSGDVPAPEGRREIAQGASPGKPSQESAIAPEGRPEAPPEKAAEKPAMTAVPSPPQAVAEAKKDEKPSASVAPPPPQDPKPKTQDLGRAESGSSAPRTQPKADGKPSVPASSPNPESPIPNPSVPKQPVPEGPALDQARKAAEALFKAEVDKAKTGPEKVALAKRLLSQAVGQAGAADQYMLLLLAQNLAVAARDVETAWQCVEQIDGLFVVDRFALKTAILSGWAKEARTPDARKWIIEQMLTVGDEALDGGNIEAAKELGQQITAKSSGLRDKDVAAKLKTFRQRFTEAGKDIEELRAAQAALSQDPKNPQANLVVGRHLCFTKGDWKKGLPLLAQGSDATLKSVAQQELALSSSPNPQSPIPNPFLPLGDSWWEIAASCRRSQANTIKIHAGQWYRQAVANLPAGLVRSNVEKRLTEVAKLRSQLPRPPLAIAPFDEKQARQHQQRWAEYLGTPVELTNSIGMKFVLIPPGEFEMGATSEEIAVALTEARKSSDTWVPDRIPGEAPRHRVRISRPYYLGVYEVTQGEYAQVMGVNPSAFTEKQMAATLFKPALSEAVIKERVGDAKRVAGKDTSRHPVETVSWDDAAQYFQKLSALPGETAARRLYRLPSEAEWEYACRAGTTTRWSSGDEAARLLEHGWVRDNAGSMTHPVGEKKANGLGLYDMHGNVWEWCLDWYSKDYYGKSPAVDPPGPPSGSARVNRGGAWYYGAAWLCRSAFRFSYGPGARAHYLGLRALLVPAE